MLKPEEHRVYEFIVRRFLACCSEDAKGESSEVEILYGSDEYFHIKGLTVLERNYLDVYVYDKWESSAPLPVFQEREVFEPTEAVITEGKTTAPNYLTEPELIALMDANGIGTDATMSEHIAKIKEREYVATRPRGGTTNSSSTNSGNSGRGRGRGRGGRAITTHQRNGAVEEFIPTRLGIALIEGYDNIVASYPDSPSLSKPFLRKEMELRMRDICAGTKSRSEVVHESLEMYRALFVQTQLQIDVLKLACRKYVLEQDV